MSMTSMKPCYCQYISITRTAIMESSSRYLNVHHKSEPYNQNYENDLRNNLQLNVWIMKIIGTWPLTHSSIEMLWYRVLNVICYILLALLLIPSGIYIVLEIKDFYNQLKLGSALTFFFMAVLKYCALLLRENDIRKCVDYIKSDWRNVRYTDERRIMLQNANFGRRLVVICSVLMYGGVTFYFVAVPLTRAKIKEEDTNLTYRRLVFPVPSVIVDARRSPVNEIFYFIQLFAGFIAHNITVAACSLAALLAMHARGQLQVLMSWINHLVDGREGVNDTTNERLAKIIQLHMRILKNAKFGRRLVSICAFFMYGGAVFYYLALPFSKGKITESDGNLTYRPLVYPVASVILDARHSPISEILFWIQCLSGFIAHSITAGACSLAAVFAMHAYGRLEVLIQWIEHLVDGREDFCNNVDERLAMIVQQHVRILHNVRAFITSTRHKIIIMEKTNPVIDVNDYKKDLRLSIQLNRWILKPLGAWPKSIKISFIERYAYMLVNVICISLIGFLFVPSAIYLVLEMDDAYNILKLTGPLNFCLMAVIKYSSLIFRENDIRSGIEYIANDWINTRYYDDRMIMIKSAKFGRRLVTICAVFMYGGATFYYLALPLSNGKITEDGGNLTYRPLMYPVSSMIVDTRCSPIGEIFFCVQCLSGFIVHSITTGACSLAAVFAMHAYGRLEVLMQWIEHLVDGREDFCDNVDERLAMIVQQHVRILQYTVQVHRFIMGLIGVWPNMEKSGKWARLLRGLLRTACCFLLSFNLIPWVLYMFLILDTFKKRLRMIGGFFFYSMVPAMYFTLMLREDRIKKCIRHLQEDWRNVWDANDRKIMLDQARAGRFVIICTLLFLFTSGFTHRLIKPILRGTIVIGNVSIRPLVQGNYFIFFDPQQSPAYEIVFSMHLVTGIVIYIVTTSVCGITALFSMHACGQLKMLTVWLENTAIENQWSKCAIAQRLAAIVMHHVRIRKVRLLGPLLNCGMGCLKYSLLMYHAREIQSCLKQALHDWRDTVDWKNRKIMLSKAKIGRRFAIISAVFMYVGGLSYRTLVPLSKGRMLTPMNTTVRALACPSYFIKFDEQASPAYEIVFTLQFFAGLITYSVTVGAAGLAAFFVMHICGQLNILIVKFKHLNNIPEPEDRPVAILLADIVEHQIKVKT
ncbi:hypothetical protein G5I_08482 [Acromyrmex echinatior]|uniref:Odorant receptor 13a n=1 Tax=Acromyrmex echinatior TaxID=103372 RepID=F4WRM9_ACREC|nr:hypothetical protein G5I_08482 [Acromyrmex echinatior]